MKTTLTSKGQLTLPKRIRDALGLRPGDELLVELEEGRVVLTPRRRYRADELDRLIPHAKKAFPGFARGEETALKARAAKEPH